MIAQDSPKHSVRFSEPKFITVHIPNFTKFVKALFTCLVTLMFCCVSEYESDSNHGVHMSEGDVEDKET